MSCSRLDRGHLRRYHEYSEREILRSDSDMVYLGSDSYFPISHVPDQESPASVLHIL